MTTYRGMPVAYATFHRTTDTYALFDDGHNCIAEMKAREFLMLPNRQQLEIRSGRNRRTASQDQCGSAGKSGKSRHYNSWIDAWIEADDDTAANQAASPRIGKQLKVRIPPSPVFMGLDAADEKPKPPLKREGIIAGEIVGYRCWRIEKGLLHSVYQRDCWMPGQPLEVRELGDWDHRGIHAWKDAGSKHYHEYIRSYLNDTDPLGFRSLVFYFGSKGVDREEPRSRQPAMVTGTVFLWGDVVEHERGWRAEFARVRSLDWLYPDETMMGHEEEALNRLRAKYGVLT